MPKQQTAPPFYRIAWIRDDPRQYDHGESDAPEAQAQRQKDEQYHVHHAPPAHAAGEHVVATSEVVQVCIVLQF